MMTTPATPTVQRRRLGALLKAAREAAGLRREQVAERMEISVPTVGRIENGRSGIRLRDLRALMDLYQVRAADERAELESLARSGSQSGWWASSPLAIKTSYQTYIGFEQAASDLYSYENTYIPGLLQTADYARETFSHALPRPTEELIERRLQVRLQRQERLAAGSMYLSVVLDESAVLRRVGGRKAWLAQLHALVEQAEKPHITLQIMPFEVGAHPGASAFVVLRFQDDPDVAYIEQPTGGDLFYDGAEAQQYVETFEALRALALPAPLSLARLYEVLNNEG